MRSEEDRRHREDTGGGRKMPRAFLITHRRYNGTEEEIGEAERGANINTIFKTKCKFLKSILIGQRLGASACNKRTLKFLYNSISEIGNFILVTLYNLMQCRLFCIF